MAPGSLQSVVAAAQQPKRGQRANVAVIGAGVVTGMGAPTFRSRRARFDMIARVAAEGRVLGLDLVEWSMLLTGAALMGVATLLL